MPDFKVDKEGFLLNDNGEKYLIENEPIKVTNYTSQDVIDQKVQERLQREAKKFQDQIKALEKQANKTPELESLLQETKQQLSDTEEKLKKASSTAQEQVSAQMSALKKERDEAINTAQNVSNEFDQFKVKHLILQHCFKDGKPLFVAPDEDVVPKFLSRHKREPIRDDSGKIIDGQQMDLFKVEVKGKDGNMEEKYLPIDKAMEVFAVDPRYSRYLTGNSFQGSTFRGNSVNPSRISNSGNEENISGVDRIKRGISEGGLPTGSKRSLANS